MAGTWTRSIPEVSSDAEAYWDGARNGKLIIQRCANCGKHQHIYRRDFCSHCWSREVADVVASGLGTVWTYTVTYQNRTPGYAELVPYVVAVVELEEGVRMVSNIVNCEPESVRIGMPVKVTFANATDEIAVPFFEPA